MLFTLWPIIAPITQPSLPNKAARLSMSVSMMNSWVKDMRCNGCCSDCGKPNEPHDAILIMDADSSISPNFLRVMDARLARGERVIQSYYAVRDPEQSWSVSLRYVALAALHYLRPLGRMVLGGSMGLKGNGMVFAADILKKHEWSASITEDIEFHMALVLDGERVMFAPDAVVEAEMPQDLAGSQTQNTRWEQGRLEMARTYVPKLLRQARLAAETEGIRPCLSLF